MSKDIRLIHRMQKRVDNAHAAQKLAVLHVLRIQNLALRGLGGGGHQTVVKRKTVFTANAQRGFQQLGAGRVVVHGLQHQRHLGRDALVRQAQASTKPAFAYSSASE